VNEPATIESTPLLFDWEPPRRRKLTIVAFLAASLVGHAFGFYMFQIIYPPTVAILPPPVRLSLISPSTEEGRSLLRWIEAEDPALAFATQRPPEARQRVLPKVEHVPSYLANEPAIQEMPPLTIDLQTPSSQPAAPVPIKHEKLPSAGEIATTVWFSDELTGFGSPTLPPAKFAASTNESPQDMRFRIAVNAEGEIHYCFAINSSGDPALDEEARQHLILCRFPARSTPDGAAGETLTWGVAAIEWGTDVARSQSKLETSGKQ
jgi:hypothetical protein